MIFDCVIVGGGPAGLSAALLLGRAKRQVVMIDHNKPRNAVTRSSHGFITRDGISPQQFRVLAQQDLAQYPGIQTIQQKVAHIEQVEAGLFKVTTEGVAEGKTEYQSYLCRKIILATGLKESLPAIAGIEAYYGQSLFGCPYCDGWEMRDKPIVFITESIYAFHMVKQIYHWSNDLVVCTNGQNIFSTEQKDVLEAKGIVVNEQPIAALQGQDGQLEEVLFQNNTSIKRNGGFVTTSWQQGSQLAETLGCALNERGAIATDEIGRTSVKHIYAAGDNAIIEPAQLIVAAAEGNKAAMGVNIDLIMEEF